MMAYLASLPDWQLNILLGAEALLLVICLIGFVFYTRRQMQESFFHEEIACASIKFADIGVLSLPAPARHHHVMWSRLLFMGTPMHNCVQGFLTTSGRFVDRAEGLRIAEKRGQIVEKHGNEGELYSEDMWPSIPAAIGYTISHSDD
jgi:hypothetical protein